MEALNRLNRIAHTLVAGARRDSGVRLAVGSSAAVLMGAGIIGLGGAAHPLLAQGNPQVRVAHAQAPQSLQVIDAATTTVSELIEQNPLMQRYWLMLYNSGAGDELRGGGHTVFVPTDNSFDYLPASTIARLSYVEMRTLSLHHIGARVLPMEESLNGNAVTLAGDTVAFKVDAGAQSVMVGDAQVIKAYRCKDGMVYLINKVLVPQQQT